LKYFLQKCLSEWEVRQHALPDFLYIFLQKNLPDLSERYVSVKDALITYLKNKNLDYTHYNIEALKANKKSETLFILGCSRFINDIPETTWTKLKHFDTLGFNYWFYHHFAPTYYSVEMGFTRMPAANKHFLEAFNKRKEDYKNTIYLVSSRQRRRGFHPLLTPEYFPVNPKVGNFLSPKPIKLPLDQPFSKRAFRKSMFYRGSLNLYLYFARLMEFKKIVLVGCEMDSAIPFFENFPEAQWMDEVPGYQDGPKKRLKNRYQGFYSTKNKHSMVNAILAIDEFVFRPEGIELYVFNANSVLHPRIPLYKF